VERRTFVLPRLNSPSGARIAFELDRVVEKLLMPVQRLGA
jgi:hypothetical protein